MLSQPVMTMLAQHDALALQRGVACTASSSTTCSNRGSQQDPYVSLLKAATADCLLTHAALVTEDSLT